MSHLSAPLFVADTTPYPWPWNGELTAHGTAILVVNGSGGGQVFDSIRALTATIRSVGGAVVHVATAPPRGESAPTGFDDDRESPIVDLVDGDQLVTSSGIDGFFGSSLDATLRRQGIDRLILVGSPLETSVHSTMRSANDRGYECLLVADCCLAYDDDLVAAALSMIEMSGGIFGAVGSAAATTAALTLSATSTMNGQKGPAS
ncbi:MAG TPA: hypothetical protein DCP11_13965 [Microbacteriaceae bacterium]|jgi:nicotinamidase-related amidase|nr:hypothetical protein [Microbacteriaceae bacterium]